MTACGDEHRHLLSEISYGIGGVLDYSFLVVLLRCQCSKTWRLGCLDEATAAEVWVGHCLASRDWSVMIFTLRSYRMGPPT
jgi:hypothetical protein